jgi:methionyl aminopeptidase
MIQLKSESDIAIMQESSRIVSDVHRLLRPHVTAGAVVAELDMMAEEFIRSQGARPAFKGYPSGTRGIPTFPGTLCVSIDSEVVHGVPDKRVVEDGQIVSIDVGAEIHGFFGDGAMTLAVGTVDPDKLRLMRVTREALYRGIEKAYPGNRLGDVSAAIQEHVEFHGYSVVRDLVGHGIGRKLHEEPAVPNFGTPGTGVTLEAGMTLAIEPMVNAGSHRVKVARNGWTILTQDGSASAHFEHTIYISKDGPMLLTNHFEREHGETGTDNS